MSEKTFNFDTAMRARTVAASKGIGSKEWIDFAHMMFDSFPTIYEIARRMTVHQDDLSAERNSMKQQRDELLAALKEARERMLVSYMHEGEGINKNRRITFMDLDVVDAAIAKAEASK